MRLLAPTAPRIVGTLCVLGIGIGAYVFFERQKEKNLERAKYGDDGVRIERLRAKASDDVCNKAVARELATLLLIHEQSYEAATALSAALDNCPFDAAMAEQAARLWRKAGELQRALALGEKMVSEMPLLAAGYSVRAGVSADLGLMQKAVADYRQVFEFQKGNVEAGRVLAETLEREKDLCGAADILDQMLAMSRPADTEWLIARARRLRAVGGCARERVEGGRAVIPYRADSEVMVVDVRVNDRLDGQLVFDTGASAVTLTRDFASRLGIALEDGEPYYVTTAGGAAVAYRVVLDEVRLGAATVTNVGAAIVPNMSLGESIDGLLGNTFLSHFRVNVDAREGHIELETLY